MQGVDYRTYPVLCVDDEESNLIIMRYALESFFTVETTSDTAEAAELLATRRFALLLSDQRMPGLSGVDLCAHARVVSPDTVRIILTGYADVHATIDAVNRGAVMRYLEKPVRDAHLQEVVRSAIDVVHAKRAINALESQMLRGGSDEAFRALEARLARDLVGPTEQLDNALAHLRDLTTALRDIRQTRPKESAPPSDRPSVTPILEDMIHTHDSMETTLKMFHQLTDRLRKNRSQKTLRADLRRIVRSIEALAGRAGDESEEPLEVPFDPAVLAQAFGTFFRRALFVSKKPDDAELRIVAGSPIAVVIKDTGPPLKPRDLAALFDARLDPLPGDDGQAMALAVETLRGLAATVEADQGDGFCEIRVTLKAQT